MGNKSVDYGHTAFNCTHPMGVANCPIHSANPGAPLMDCKYEASILTNGKAIWIENGKKD